MIRALLFLLIFLLTPQLSIAIRQGTATADIFIRRYERSGDFGRLALWHEAAAECLERISVPMNEIAYDYYKRHGYEKWAARTKKEAREIHKQHQYHRTRAETAWQKFVGGVCNPDTSKQVGGVCNPDTSKQVGGVCNPDTSKQVGGVCNPDTSKQVGGVCNPDTSKQVGGVCNPDTFAALNAERQNIAKFIAIWLPRYPDRFYEFGIYPTFFKKQRELAAQERNYAKVLRLEADAAEMCAAQYQYIPIAYRLKRYEKLRDAYLRHATHLRELAQQNPMVLPPQVDAGKQILGSLEIQRIPSQETAAATIQIAKSDARVKTALANQNGVRAYPSFQGFAWIVSFANHSHGNIALAIIEKKTMKILDAHIPSP